jgi:hypothetical protein
MGLIRKSLMVGSFGLVRGSSKKQRVAKATLREAQAQTQLIRQATRPTGPPPPPAKVTDADLRAFGIGAAPRPTPEPPGWRPAPDGTIRWFDGFRLTDIQHPQP